ncbi:MAG: AraC family transcriptional regulator [Candidatus Aenigmarchaeota archaeon]|nr:AraC family transcriptional regulator [Candidatus Aenigmarchaeota archaeon]
MMEILVMDCEARESFWMTLKSEYKILFATTAKRGLNMLSENVDIVFIGMELQDMNSMEVLSLIKKEHPSTAVIIIASCATEEMYMEAFGKVAGDYVRRPLEDEDILQRIKILLNARDASQRRKHVSLPTETTQNEQYPDIPSHIVDGVLKVRDFVAQNYADSLTLAAACKMAAISKTYFCRFFKSITGHSLRSYHHVVKIRMAEELLRDKRLSIKDIARKLGYCDANYFSTIYKRFTGVSPKQRHTYHQNPDTPPFF